MTLHYIHDFFHQPQTKSREIRGKTKGTQLYDPNEFRASDDI